MAATAIPLALGVLPDVINLIAGLVHKHAPVAEANYGNSTGPVKFADVFGKVLMDLQSAAGAGTISKSLPSDESIKLIIQSVVTSLKLQGQLGSGSPQNAITGPSVGSQGTITLRAGQTLSIVVV